MPANVYMTSSIVDRAQDAEELKKEVQFEATSSFLHDHERACAPRRLTTSSSSRYPSCSGPAGGGRERDAAVGRERQKDAMNATLPIGKNFINAPSTMTTANVGALIPFTSRRYQDPGGIYWGSTRESEDFIMLSTGRRSARRTRWCSGSRARASRSACAGRTCRSCFDAPVRRSTSRPRLA